MWTSFVVTLKSKPIQKISVFSHKRRITYSEVIELWQDNKEFCSFFSSLLAYAPFSAYFWETPPITLSTVNKPFEFVLVDSPQLAGVQPDSSSFREYFQSARSSVGEEVITFPNLGNDALLVVPCPLAENSAYCHIASFVREAPQSQQHALWQTVGKVIQQNLNDQPLWVSTSGLGVYWLHIRLDSYPKYYTFNPYKV
jgi:hypothetical protein